MKSYFTIFLICVLLSGKVQAQVGVVLGLNSSPTKEKYRIKDIDRKSNNTQKLFVNIPDKNFGLYYKQDLKNTTLLYTLEHLDVNSLHFNEKKRPYLFMYAKSIRLGVNYYKDFNKYFFCNLGVGLNFNYEVGSYVFKTASLPSTKMLYLPLPDFKAGIGVSIVPELIHFELDARIALPVSFKYEGDIMTFPPFVFNAILYLGLPTHYATKKNRKRKASNKRVVCP